MEGLDWLKFPRKINKIKLKNCLNHLNAELNPARHLLALVGAHHFVHVSRIRVKQCICDTVFTDCLALIICAASSPTVCTLGESPVTFQQ
jgi:hypothetical protein